MCFINIRKIRFQYLVILFILSNILVNAQTNKSQFCINFDFQSPKVEFAVSEVKAVVNSASNSVTENDIQSGLKLKSSSYNLVFLNLNSANDLKIINKNKIARTAELKKEGFLIQRASKADKTIFVVGYDDAGTMYGGFELAEIIKTQGIDAVQSQLQNPYMKVRGVKYNIPLDMRSPTYTEPSNAAQNNIDDVWDFEYWKEYIDNLSRYRYNLVSLWNMHPFPSMVKLSDYPDIALNDVRRSTGNWKENYSLNGWGFDAPEIMKSFEVVKKMTIDEKIDFWRRVMAYGKERNVCFYMVTWNIFIYGVDGKYGITDKAENKITTDYFRKSVKQMLLTYPDLAGIGLTTGENMYNYSAKEKEEWAYATYGLGVLDALKEQPNRKIDFIHRQHQTKAKEITNIFKGITENKNVNFLFSFKYAQAHVYSSTTQTFHPDFVEDIKGENLKTLWTLRNDDNFYFRWGAPDFVREFIKNMPYDISEGYYFGSDQYVWGRDFLTKNNSGKTQLDITKQWYHWMIWGRLGYNPQLGNDRFVSLIQTRFPEINAPEMFQAWQNASLIYPLVTGFHWGALDFQWYIESGQSQPSVSKTPSGYHDVTNFINLKPHPGTDNIAIPAYVKAFLSNTELKGTTPLQLADKILKVSNNALDWAVKLDKTKSLELQFTIDDIKAMAWLGKYYAHKIKAATYTAIFRETLKKEWQTKMFDELNLSASYWRHYAAVGISNYQNPLWTNRVGYVDWKKNFKWSNYEITSAGGKVQLTSMQPTAGGTILEAEDAIKSIAADTKFGGFTGKGYIGSGEGHANSPFVWNYNAAEAGKYIFEFRYSLNRDDASPVKLLIDDKEVAEVQFWNCGNAGNWVWERVTVDLKKGVNTISLAPERFVLLDHLNIIGVGK